MGHTVYNPATSGKIDSGETWSISYGDGSSASGNIYFDTVKVGDTTVTSQAVEAAETVSAQFQMDTANDGLLGLAFDSINTATPNKVATFFENAMPGLAAPVFTANLKKGEPGNYNFGYIDSAEYTGDITYVSVSTANGFWEFPSNGYAVGSGAFVSESIDAIADTGTTLLYLPADAVSAYYAKVPGAFDSPAVGGYVFPCGATLPSITLGIAGYRAVVPGSYINYAPASETGKLAPIFLPSCIADMLMILCQSALVGFRRIPALASPSSAISSLKVNSWFSTEPVAQSSGSQPRHETNVAGVHLVNVSLFFFFPYLPRTSDRSVTLHLGDINSMYHYVSAHRKLTDSCGLVYANRRSILAFRFARTRIEP